MIKLIALLKRKPGLTREEFADRWLNDHIKLSSKMPGLRGYRVNIAIDHQPDGDGVEPIYDGSYQRKIDTVKIFGKGSLAISTSIEPLTLRVTREYPLSISSNALVAWTGNLIPTVVDDKGMEGVMIENNDAAGFKIRFEGDGVVVSEQ